jgi:hypothetical protein
MTQATPTVSSAPSLGGLEEVYDALAQAIDQAGPDAASCSWSSWCCSTPAPGQRRVLLREHIDQALRDL